MKDDTFGVLMMAAMVLAYATLGFLVLSSQCRDVETPRFYWSG